MRIVIDLEAAQTPQSRHRGIGRYSLSLAQAMLRLGRDHEFIVALNGGYEGTAAPVRRVLDGLLPPGNVLTWHPTVPPQYTSRSDDRRACEIVREAFFASLDADVVHVASLFEYGPYSFTTIGTGRGNHRTALTLYDLIPHLNRSVYLHGEAAAREYDRRLDNLKRADLLLAISEASRQEGIEHLGLPAGRVVNISSATEGHFTPARLAVPEEVALRAQYSLYRPFVMYTGGIDPRKNIPRLIEAWSRLPAAMRDSHQLALVCSVQPAERASLEEVARNAGLAPGELVMTGYVPENDLVGLYRLCKLFVFPSLHEGFGLPALEAMRCGAPVIGANNSSIPEVIGRADALFDAHSTDAIATCIAHVLGDDTFRADLARYGPRQAEKFSWDLSARAALDAIEQLGPAPKPQRPAGPARPRLAYVAPLPPQRSGIADYSAELLPALAEHYEVDAIVDQEQVDDAVRASVAAVHDAAWFMDNAARYDRILYHFGNSNFHEYMVPLLRRHPGTVVLHDFFLSGMHANREFVTERQPHWTRALYESHGWGALDERLRAHDMTGVIHDYPANFEVLREARGIIAHSPLSRELAMQWYGPQLTHGWREIPHLRVPLERRREEARAELGLGPNDFLLCSFGIMGPTKMNDRLLRAWKRSKLADDARCHLVFVGENDAGDYGKNLLREIESAQGRVRITGWASPEVFRRYLNAADAAVQLRALSRGETSGTVLDAMCHGVPVIANANGTMAYLPREAAIVLDETFEDAQLVDALDRLRSDAGLRESMGRAGREIIETRHSPAHCASLYADAIEAFALEDKPRAMDVAGELGALLENASTQLVGGLAEALAQNLPAPAPARQWLVDIGDVHDDGDALPDSLVELFKSRGPGWRAEPVHRAADGRWRYARNAMLPKVNGWVGLLDEDLVDMRPGDVWAPRADGVPQEAADRGLPALAIPGQCHPDIFWAWVGSHSDMREVPRCFVDISELVRHDWQAGIQRVVKHWLLELLRRAPAGMSIVPVYTPPEFGPYRIATDYINEAAGTGRARVDDWRLDPVVEPRSGDIFFALDLQPHFIASHEQMLDSWRARGAKVAFMVYDLLPVSLPGCFFPDAARHHERWLGVVAKSDMAICISRAVADELSQWIAAHAPEGTRPRIRHVHLGADIGSRIGTQGIPAQAQGVLAAMHTRPAFLMVGTLEPRKAHAAVLDAFEELWAQGVDCMLVIVGRPGWMVENLASRLRSHPESGVRLHWLDDASDETLDAAYGAAAATILASRGEGFGLPLVEAAQRGLPAIARDLPVFREIAGNHAHYFADDSSLAASLREWLELHARGAHPRPEGMAWLTWAQSADRLRRVLEGLQPGYAGT